MMSRSVESVVQSCEGLILSIEQGLSWINDHVRQQEGQLADRNQLLNLRRLARKLHHSAQRRPCVAVFGQSQAGKSYLVSSLVKVQGADSLQVVIPGESDPVDFIKHINPSGGQESTGIVTRFTVEEQHRAGDLPILLRLLRQVDLVKIIANGYFSDLTNRKIDIDRDAIQERLEEFRALCGNEDVPGFSRDDVFELKEYLNRDFANESLIKDLYTIGFWNDLSDILPRISHRDRSRLLSLLWGEIEELTTLFDRLSDGLQQLDFVSEVRCGLEALKPKTTQVKGKTVCNTIIDVRILQGLVKPDGLPPVEVQGPKTKRTNISRSTMSALIEEISLVLPAATLRDDQNRFLKHVDILDFPGARSRNKIPVQKLSLHSQSAGREVIEVFLRGKISYLFDNYSDNSEVTALLLCQSHEQPEVMTVPQIVADWVYSTYGEQPAQRLNKANALFAVFTKFNVEMTGKPDDELGVPKSHDDKWSARFGANFHNYMSKSVLQDWISEWSQGQWFKNCFLLRDPRFSRLIYQGVSAEGAGSEEAYHDSFEQKLEDMKASFVAHPKVRNLFEDPHRAWEEVSGLNRTGVAYIAEKLIPICEAGLKQQQLAFKLNALQSDACGILMRHYQHADKAKALAQAMEKAKQVVADVYRVMQEHNNFGLLVDVLNVSEDFVWKAFFDIENPPISEREPEHSGSNPKIKIDPKEFEEIDGLGGILGDMGLTPDPNVASQPVYQPKSERFAELLLERWLARLDEVGSNTQLLANIGISQETFGLLAQEFRKTMSRVEAVRIISASVEKEISRPRAGTNIDLVARLGSLALNRFVNTVGWGFVDTNQRPTVPVNGSHEQPIFETPDISAPNEIRLDVSFPGLRYFKFWLKGLHETFTANVDHVFGGERLNVIANESLHTILKQLDCSL